VAGVPRLIHDNEDGLLVEPGSVPALTASLARLLRDDGLRDRLRRAGRQTIETSYSFQVRMDKVRQLYDALLSPGQ
jgi:glycosyltransferase involved in cell wall biosynthesis